MTGPERVAVWLLSLLFAAGVVLSVMGYLGLWRAVSLS